MPFTPLHMGPGVAIKAFAGRHFSLVAFGAAQVAIDIEPLVRMLRGDEVLHGPTHTYVGALLIALALFPLVRVLYPALSRGWAVHGEQLAVLLPMPKQAPALPVLAGLLVGTLSHVVLDNVMHADMHPFWPESDDRFLYGWVDIDTLHLFCVLAGVVGLGAVVLRAVVSRRRDVGSWPR